MNIEQLEYIVSIAKTGSLTGASRKEHVSLPAISQAITSMETELGLSLFTRARGQGAVPTLEGQIIIRKADEILTLLQDIRDEAMSYKHTLSGELRIATIPGPMHLLVDVVSNFKKDFPQVKIQIWEKGPKEIMDDLQHQRIDVGLMVFFEREMKKEKGVIFEKLREGRIVVGVHAHSSLALESSIRPEQMINQTLVLYDDEYISWYMEQFMKKYGPVDILFKTNNVQAIEKAVREEIAITVGIDYSFSANHASIKPLMLELPEEHPVYYGWVEREGSSSPIVEKFIHRLKLVH
ncbi:DNA-binding transcriptional LysR family regulator [Paenibacillus shirakamiensis]|uniref:DNA-binding transcriptional LysR family regulator n=1 Tax=Paenibacillus shirakamiensis TaxID=1265935 RepID=A0ABS4JL35_9BACL|nr:LysR family transcriptional regulator [Paenibacillus shirakamiensis]MBP2001314.1 DNA-binding transcriptional LysR family regulator [Paenibacillus shirakamiensis]